MPTLALLALALTARAADPAVAVTSFYYTNQYPDRTAEICGTVTGAPGSATRVVVTIDPGDHEGTYVAWPGHNGRWCTLVNSLSGHATAALWNGNARAEEAAVVEALAHATAR